jgi:hypothetical protein
LSERTFLVLPNKVESKKPSFERYDIQLPESLIRYFVSRFSKAGDYVLDPFAGLGSTISVCEELARIPFGIESDPKRHAWICSHTAHPNNIILGDSGKISSFGFPKFDFSFTSPPYMPRHHRWNPLCNGNPKHAGYKSYHRRLRQIYKSIGACMKRGAKVVLQVDNLKGKQVSPLAWDIAETISKVLKFEGEMVIGWDGNKDVDYNHTYCLLFKK